MDMSTLEALATFRPEAVVMFLILLIFRPLGLLFGFTVFSWGIGAGLMTRIAIALPLGIFAFANDSFDVEVVVRTATLQRALIVLVIEFAIGFGLGAMMSSSFHAFKYAGALTDTYRGENNTGIQDPSGGEIHTFSVLYFLLGSYVFCVSGGFTIMVENLFLTYKIWPVGSEVIDFDSDAWRLGGQLVQRSLILAFVIAAPLLLLMLSIDFVLAVAARIAPKMHMYENSFLLKNFAAVALLPVMMMLMLEISDNELGYAYEAVSNMSRFIE